MQLFLTESERERIEQWYKSLWPRILEVMRNKGISELISGNPYYGASGGGLTYEYTPTNLGEIIKVREFYTDETLDLTDYESW